MSAAPFSLSSVTSSVTYCATYVKKYQKYGALLLSDPLIPKQLLLCTLNIIYLAGKCFTSLPALVPNLAYVARCLYPVMDLKFGVQRCIKCVTDVQVVCKARCWSVLPWTAISLFVSASSLFLTIGSLVAALSIMRSYGAFADRLFAVLAPLGQMAFLLDQVKDVLTLLPDKQTMDAFSSRTFPSPTSEPYLYLRIRLYTKKDWEDWEKLPHSEQAEQACELLKAVSFYTRVNSVQAMLFFPANALIKRYPNSRLEAVIYLAFSLNVLWNQIRLACEVKNILPS